MDFPTAVSELDQAQNPTVSKCVTSVINTLLVPGAMDCSLPCLWCQIAPDPKIKPRLLGFPHTIPKQAKNISFLSEKKTWTRLLTCYWWTIMLLVCITGPDLL